MKNADRSLKTYDQAYFKSAVSPLLDWNMGSVLSKNTTNEKI
jgi:hypothetical protein